MTGPRSDGSKPAEVPPDPREIGANNPANPSMEQPEAPGPALGRPGGHVVQVNVMEDMPEDGDSQPVDEAATVHYGVYLPRTLAMIAVAVVVTLLLAFPVVWGLVELVILAGVAGPLVWLYAALMIALLVGAVVIGFHIAQSGL